MKIKKKFEIDGYEKIILGDMTLIGALFNIRSQVMAVARLRAQGYGVSARPNLPLMAPCGS